MLPVSASIGGAYQGLAGLAPNLNAKYDCHQKYISWTLIGLLNKLCFKICKLLLRHMVGAMYMSGEENGVQRIYAMCKNLPHSNLRPLHGAQAEFSYR